MSAPDVVDACPRGPGWRIDRSVPRVGDEVRLEAVVRQALH